MVGRRIYLVDNPFNVDAISANVSRMAQRANEQFRHHDVAAVRQVDEIALYIVDEVCDKHFARGSDHVGHAQIFID